MVKTVKNLNAIFCKKASSNRQTEVFVVAMSFHIFTFFFRTTGPISTKLGTKHPWVMRTEVCSNEGLCPFPRGDNYKLVKIHWQNFKHLLLKNHLANFNQTWHKASFSDGDLFKWRPHPFPRGDDYEIAKIYWL